MLSFFIVCVVVVLFIVMLGANGSGSPATTPTPSSAIAPPLPKPAAKQPVASRLPQPKPLPLPKSPSVAKRPVVVRARQVPTPATSRASFTTPTSEFELEVSKALTQIERWATPLGRTLWGEKERRADWLHDLTIMRQHRDLGYVRLELLDANNTVLHTFELKFDQQRTSPQSIIDSANGVEIPILPPAERQRIVAHRLLINSSAQRASYQELLKLNWSPAAKLRDENQSQFESQHARKITGGRLAGEVRVAQAAMQTLVITNTGAQGYAFATSLDQPGLTNVFLHPHEAAKNVAFTPGRRVRALVIQTPRGLQARNIQLAT